MINRSSPFTRFSKWTAQAAGHPLTFGTAVFIVLAWLISGPAFHFSDTWQLVINTGTTIVTFLIVFLIQSTQNRDSHAVQIKLDELIRAQQGAHIALLDLEELSEGELNRIRDHYEELARKARLEIRSGRNDTGIPRVTIDWAGDRTGSETESKPEASRPTGATTGRGDTRADTK